MIEDKGGQFYGAVTVSDRGQIVIPAQARRELGIEIGEKLLVISGPGDGLILVRASALNRIVSRWAELVQQLRIAEQTDETTEEVDGVAEEGP